MATLMSKKTNHNQLATAGLNLSLTLIVVAAVLASSCTPNQRIIEAGRTPEPPPANATPAASSFEDDLQAMQNADFNFILVFRRKDGAIMDRDDKAFVNVYTPDANRKKLSDDGKAIIIGSNFPFFPGTLISLTERFVMEDHSKPDSGPIEVDHYGNSNISNLSNKNGGIIDTETAAEEAEKNERQRRHPQNKR